MNYKALLDQNGGILPMMPVFIPRTFGLPGFRLRLHPDDYYAFGMNRGAIKERWFSSIVTAMNGPHTREDEGMSYVVLDGDVSKKILFKDFVDTLGEALIGSELMDRYGTWPIFAKFFDYGTPLFHHLHLREEHAEMVGRNGKPEAYYFPRQLNNHVGQCPVTYFGFDPSVTPEQVKDCIRNFGVRDTRITELSRAYRVELGTGWYTAPGVVHAPASLLTYEPQWNSDVNSIYENVTAGEINGMDMLVGNCPEDKKDDIDFIFSLIDWENSTRRDYRETFFRPPLACNANQPQEGLEEKWIAYANPYVSAKEVTVAPGAEVVVKDDACYGCILLEGHGMFGAHVCETPTMIRFGQTYNDEFFVSADAAKKGVVIKNTSKYQPLVILKHFAPDNHEMPTL